MRTGRAVVVVLRGTRRTPQIVVRLEVQLSDRWVPESLHPYHQELGDSGASARRARRRGCRAAENATRRAVRTLLREMRSHGLEPRAAGVVVARLVDPARVAAAHPRAHAEEDELYRTAVETALKTARLRVVELLEKDVRAEVATRLRQTKPAIDATLKAFSWVVGTPWRAPEKHATLAAWLALASIVPLQKTKASRGSRGCRG